MTSPIVPETLTLNDLLTLGEGANPELAVARRGMDIAAAQTRESGIYPNPSLQIVGEDYLAGDRSVTRMKRLAGVTVPLIVNGRLGRAVEASRFREQEVASHVDWKRREVRAEITLAWTSLLIARRRLDIRRQSHDVAATLRDVAHSRVEAQAAPASDLLRAEVEIVMADALLRDAGQEVTSAGRTLQRAVGIDLDPARIAGDLPLPTPPPSEAAVPQASHPLLRQAAIAVEGIRAQEVRARTERIPDLQLEIAGGRDPEDRTIYQIGLSIPLPLFNRNQERIAELRALAGQAIEEERRLSREVEAAVASASQAYAAAFEQMHILEERALPAARQAHAALEEGHRLGKASLVDLLDARRRWLDTEWHLLDKEADLWAARVELTKHIPDLFPETR